MWPSLVLLAAAPAWGTLTLTRFDLHRVDTAVWESEAQLSVAAHSLISCCAVCEREMVPPHTNQSRQPRPTSPEDQHCNTALWEPASATCIIANVGFYPQDFLDTGGVEVYVRINPDGSLPVLCKEFGFGANS